MATLRKIRRQIQSVKNIQQITKAMYMVAAAKLRRAQQEMESSRPYSQTLDEIISRVMFRTEKRDYPLLQTREGKRTELLVFSSDRGMCGAFNKNIIRSAELFLEEAESKGQEASLVTVGKKASEYFKKHNVKLTRQYLNPEREVSLQKAIGIADEVIQRFVSGEVDAVNILYSVFHSPMVQRPTIVELLPFKPRKQLQIVRVDYLYEPDPGTLLDQLLPWHVRMQVFQAMLETRASELGARMSSMDLATKNAGDLIQGLTLKMNRARQESITKELLDIVTGAEALKR